MPPDGEGQEGVPVDPRRWRPRELVEHMRRAALPYAGAALAGIEELYETGRMDVLPQGKRILLRAILELDISEMSQGIEYESRKAPAHEVLAIGEGAARWLEKRGNPIKVGDHVYVLSTLADRASKLDSKVRLWFVDVRDVSAVLVPRQPSI